MNTQVHFVIDEKLKKQALAKAKSVGVNFSAYLRQASRDFVSGEVSLSIVRKEVLTVKNRKKHQAIAKDFQRKENISPAFSGGQQMDAYLDA